MNETFSDELDVWLSQANQASDRYVVAKVLKQTPDEKTEVVFTRTNEGERGAGPFVRKRFAREAGRGYAYERIYGAQVRGTRLAHQPIIYECVQSDGSLEVVMEYVRGVTLRDAVLRAGPGTNLAARVMPTLCDAISELHESFDQPIIHRDIKPTNVMIGERRLVVIDLGIARTYHADAQRDTVRYGTPGYAPPEQFGYGQTNVRSDVYALGMTLAFCLTGEDPTPALRESGFDDPRIPHELRGVLARATALDPAQRHPSARALREDLQRALSADPAAPRGDGPAAVAKGAKHAKTAKRRSIPRWLGTLWNVLIKLIWSLVIPACVNMVTKPSSSMADYPMWVRILGALGVGFIPWSCLFYMIMDKRRLRERRPFFSRLTWRKELTFCMSLCFVSVMLALIVAAMNQRNAGTP